MSINYLKTFSNQAGVVKVPVIPYRLNLLWKIYHKLKVNTQSF